VNERRVLNLPLAYADGLVSPKNPLTFHSFPSPPETTSFWKWIKQNHPGLKRVATISPNDDTGWWSIKVETAFVQKLGYETVAKEFFERTMTDFNPVLLRILAQKPDIISVLASPAGSVGLSIKQARELGFKGRVLHIGEVDAFGVVEYANPWGNRHFGGKDYYGIGNQIMYPMPFSEVKDGVATLVVQLLPPHN